MITVGIPKALLYYKYGNLWTNFFEELGINVLISPNTNKKILDDGVKLSMDEACISMKIYLGHINYLIDKCDYILIPRIKSLKKKEKLCTNFSCIYDLANNIFNINILELNIDIEHGESEEYAFINMGKKLGFSYFKSMEAYKIAKRKNELLNIRKYNKQKALIANSNRLKILLAGHPYNLHDDLIGKKIVTLLEKLNVDIIYSDSYDLKYMDKEVLEITKKNYFTYNKEIISSIVHYKDIVDGVILITAFPCGPDSLSNEMIERNVNFPLINLVIDTNDSSTGLETRLESFIDIITERNKKNAK